MDPRLAWPRIRPYAAGDAAQLAVLVQRCLVEVNSRDYPADVIAGLCSSYTAAQFDGLARRRRIYIAECDGSMAGTVSRERNKVFTMFVDPRWAGRGVGRQLMRHAEQQAAGEGHDHMETAASITAHAFYLALGYTDLRESETGFGLTYLMRKPLP
jgi:GNAT superfamily N-acetyltransferase